MGNDINIEFKNYIVNSFEYRLNTNFNNNNDNNLSMNFKIKSVIDIKDEGIFVTLDASVGEEEDEDCPFIVDTNITGFFKSYTSKIIEVENFRKSLVPNLIAILFPYLRSLISDITTKNNIFPTFTLPVMNIYAMLEEEDAIEIIDSRTK